MSLNIRRQASATNEAFQVDQKPRLPCEGIIPLDFADGLHTQKSFCRYLNRMKEKIKQPKQRDISYLSKPAGLAKPSWNRSRMINPLTITE